MGLKDKYKDYFKVGAAVNSNTIISHSDIITEHFNSITCENEMKYGSVAVSDGVYNLDRADRIVDFAGKNQIAVRGHTFVWHNQTPDWVFDYADKEQLLQRIRGHITTIGNRYKDDIYCWDVVNEAIEDKLDIVLRRTKWLEILGEKYMDDVFHIAKEVLPGTQLFYNDYNETNPNKRGKIIETVQGMIRRGAPIDGIGLQCHYNLYEPSVDELKRSIELYADLGLRIHITEMDISMFRNGDQSNPGKPTRRMCELQAELYDSFFKVFREYKEVIDCVTLWGVADDDTWLDNFPVRNRKNWPLLFDVEHKPKEAFHRIMNF